MPLLNLFDYEQRAAELLDKSALGYYSSGARDQISLRNNRSAWEEISLLPHILVDVSKRNSQTTILNNPISMPLIVAPTAMQKMAHPEGEIATARAVGQAGSIMILSTLSTVPVEEVTAAATGPIWFQLYIYKQMKDTAKLIERATKAGCSAIVITVDAPVWDVREADSRNQFALPEGMSLANLTGEMSNVDTQSGHASGLGANLNKYLSSSNTWQTIRDVQKLTDLPIFLKGVLRTDDALRAVDSGLQGVIISNHGGRQLDTAAPTVTRIAPVSQAVGDQIEVLVDGGIRRGTDVIKAIALGAKAVMVGRPILWGLTVDGADGVGQVLALLREEIETAMALCGCPSVADIDADLLQLPPNL
ncbi:MAG: alpha-hydroxy acid oxidase [Phycisphaerales bacterium]|nr:alpha-hydroxy acid oxidase [Phycisphaerales bacterium]